MPLFIALETLVKEGQVYSVGSEIELTQEQADRLGESRVEPVEIAEAQFPPTAQTEEDFRLMSAEDQKRKVEELGGDLKEYTNADTRWAFVSENQ